LHTVAEFLAHNGANTFTQTQRFGTDQDTAGVTETLTRIPDATAGEAGGLFIAGVNAATTLSALTVTNATTLTGAVSLGNSLTVTGTTTLSSLIMTGVLQANSLVVTTTTDLTGAITATSSSNDIRGISLKSTGADLILASSTFTQAVVNAIWDEVLDTAHEVAGSSSVLLQASGGASLDAAGVAAAVWNAATVTYGTPGTYGEALEAVGAAADPWLTNLPGVYLAGTAGYIIGNTVTPTTINVTTETTIIESE
jgi:hypothetical protein